MRRRKGSRGPSKVVVLEKYLHLLSNIWNEWDPTYVLLINTSFPVKRNRILRAWFFYTGLIRISVCKGNLRARASQSLCSSTKRSHFRQHSLQLEPGETPVQIWSPQPWGVKVRPTLYENSHIANACDRQQNVLGEYIFYGWEVRCLLCEHLARMGSVPRT